MAANIKCKQVTVGTTAVQLLQPSGSRQRALLNAPSGSVYIGPDNTVTSSSGFLLPTNLAVEVRPQNEVWAIAAAAVAVSCYEEV
jgi:hypothetical protein